MTSNLGKGLGGRLLAGLAISLLLGGCSVPQDAVAQTAGLRVTPDGKFQLLSADGKPLPRCQLCTGELEQRYGKGCLKAKEMRLDPPLCTGTVNATVTSVDQILVLQTKWNPTCITFYFMGQLYQGPCF